MGGESKMAGVFKLFGVILILGAVQVLPALSQSQVTTIEAARGGQKIVAGWEAAEGQIPHQINVRMVNSLGTVSSCGGSIIHNNWVLTAAHCTANRVTFVVRFGLTNLTRPDVIIETTRYYIHPEYNEITAGVQTDDISLIGFDTSVEYTARIQPIRLQNSEQKNTNYKGVVTTASGFGRTEDIVNGGAASEVLLWVYLVGITNDECREMYTGSSVIKDQTLCVEYYNNTAQSTCQGDSGGPVTVVDVDGQPTQVGVVSFGSTAGCNSIYPSGHVRPGHYHDWFTEITGINFDWSCDDLTPVNLPVNIDVVDPVVVV